nr:MAG TPA: hypothetical protein [Caudoviricetes sp.]
MDSLYMKFITLMALYSLLNVLYNLLTLMSIINNNMASMTPFMVFYEKSLKVVTFY